MNHTDKKMINAILSRVAAGVWRENGQCAFCLIHRQNEHDHQDWCPTKMAKDLRA